MPGRAELGKEPGDRLAAGSEQAAYDGDAALVGETTQRLDDRCVRDSDGMELHA